MLLRDARASGGAVTALFGERSPPDALQPDLRPPRRRRRQQPALPVVNPRFKNHWCRGWDSNPHASRPRSLSPIHTLPDPPVRSPLRLLQIRSPTPILPFVNTRTPLLPTFPSAKCRQPLDNKDCADPRHPAPPPPRARPQPPPSSRRPAPAPNLPPPPGARPPPLGGRGRPAIPRPSRRSLAGGNSAARAPSPALPRARLRCARARLQPPPPAGPPRPADLQRGRACGRVNLQHRLRPPGGGDTPLRSGVRGEAAGMGRAACCKAARWPSAADAPGARRRAPTAPVLPAAQPRSAPPRRSPRPIRSSRAIPSPATDAAPSRSRQLRPDANASRSRPAYPHSFRFVPCGS